MPDIDTLESVGSSSTDPDPEFTLASSGPPPSEDGTNDTSNTCQEIEIRFESRNLGELIKLLARVQHKTKTEKRPVIRTAIAFMAQHRLINKARWKDWSERINRDGNGNDLDDGLLPEIYLALLLYHAEGPKPLDIEE